MKPILTITLNPAVDLATQADQVVPGPKLRCDLPVIEPGGGGINVARAIAILGGDCEAFVAVGGPTGDHLLALMRRIDGLRLRRFDGPGETRQSLAVSDSVTQAQYRFVMPGPQWHAPDAARAAQRICALAPRPGYVVLSGSQPPGLGADFAARLGLDLPADSAFVVDTSGAPLAHLVAHPTAGIAVLRMDHAEAEDLAASPLPGVADSADFAARLVARGVAKAVVVAHEAEGSVLASADGRLHCAPAPVPDVSRIGAGDSFVGAMVLTLARGGTLAEALRMGTAAACGAVMRPSSQLCQPEDVARLHPACRVQPV